MDIHTFASLFSLLSGVIIGYVLGEKRGRTRGVKFIREHFNSMGNAEFLNFLVAAKRGDIIFKAIPSEEFKNEVVH